MDDYDLIVVGGGPAGATLARTMVAHGWRTLVLDKAAFPRDKTCAGWVTPAVWTALGEDPEAYARKHVLQPITGFRIGLMGQPHCEHQHGDSPVSYGIRRYEFDHYLLRRSGAECIQGVAVKKIVRQDGLWQLNDQYRAPWLVGAGGHFCPVAAHIGRGPGRHERMVTAKEVEFAMTPEQQQHCRVRGDRPELWFCRDLCGYAWVFRKGEYLNIGLGRDDHRHLAEHLRAFIDGLHAEDRIPADLPGQYKSHAYLLHGHARRPLAVPGCLLIGDAAGLAYTQSGEGIRPAVESALLAGQMLDRHQQAPERAIAGYQQAIRERFGPRGGGRFRVHFPAWLKGLAARPLLRSPWFTTKVVTEKWFLHTEVPALGEGGASWETGLEPGRPRAMDPARFRPLPFGGTGPHQRAR